MPTEPNESASDYPRPIYAWYVVVVLTLAYIVSFLDRQILALLIEPIKADLGISDTGISLLMGLAFGIFYALMGIPLGRLADQRNRKVIIMIGVSTWCVMTAACGLARNFGQLFVARIGVGVGEATLTPSALSMISDYFPRERRGRAIGFYNTGISVGVGIAMVLGGIVVSRVAQTSSVSVPLIGELRPWQLAFVLVGLPGLVIVALMATIREPRRRDLLSGQAQKVSLRFAANYVWSRRGVYVPIFAGLSVVTIIGYAYFSWVPSLFIRKHGFTIREVGLAYGAILLVCGPLGVLSAGWLADTLQRRGWRDGHLATTIFAVALSLPTTVLMPLMPTSDSALAMLAAASIGPGAASATGISATMMITPNQLRGQVSALYLFVISILGLTIGPTAVALLTDYVFFDESALPYSLAIVVGVASVASLLVLSSARSAYRREVRASEDW